MPSSSSDTELEALLEYLKRARGFDFTAYKRTSLTRRVQKRMETLGISGFGAYLDHLEVHPDEFGHLFNTILINVTSFFRDEEAWAFLRDEILPKVVSESGADGSVRMWSAGCASGEEAYSLAMLLAEQLGKEAYGRRVKIYATDAHETALNKARQATYNEREIEGVPEALLKKYFTQAGGSYVFDADLRRSVVFGRHDLINDSPISRIGLLVCRNTLMYFNAETQARILQRFHFALADQGYVMLGKAEMLIASGSLFTPVDLKHRIVRKVSRPPPGDRAWFLYPTPARDGNARRADAEPSRVPAPASHDLRESALRTSQVAFILVNPEGLLVMANEQARHLFGLSAEDLGRRFSDLSVYYRPIELRTPMQQALATGSSIVLADVEWTGAAGAPSRFYEVVVSPQLDREAAPLGLSVTFTDATPFRTLEHDLRESNQALETAQEELQTTNEELQSTVEELETTNEELQSTNEELETMNEELQSTNEELRTSNDELRQRSEQLDQVDRFWGAVIGGLPAGMIVLDAESRVQVWNARAEDLWGLRADEVRGKHLQNLDFGLPLEKLSVPLRECQQGKVSSREVVVPATNRRGRAVQVRVEITPLPRAGEGKERPGPKGCLILMQEMPA